MVIISINDEDNELDVFEIDSSDEEEDIGTFSRIGHLSNVEEYSLNNDVNINTEKCSLDERFYEKDLDFDYQHKNLNTHTDRLSVYTQMNTQRSYHVNRTSITRFNHNFESEDITTINERLLQDLILNSMKSLYQELGNSVLNTHFRALVKDIDLLDNQTLAPFYNIKAFELLIKNFFDNIDINKIIDDENIFRKSDVFEYIKLKLKSEYEKME